MAAGPDGRRDWLLAIDTATSRVVVAAAALDGTPLGVTTWEAGRTHGEQLLPAIGRLTGEANLRRSRIRGVIVGTGPGAFTGLRVGLATAKALAHELGVPIVGVSTAEALLDGERRRRPRACSSCRPARTTGWRSGPVAADAPARRHRARAGGRATSLVALDLDGRAPADALARGEVARTGSPPALVRLGAARLAAGDVDDLARLVPEYVSLPRGVRARDRGGRMVARPPLKLTIEAMRLEDLEEVQRIEQASFTTPWPENAYRSELMTNRLASYLVARIDGRIVAYGGMWLMVDEAHITTFAVHPGLAPPADRRAAAPRVPRPRPRPARPRGDARGPPVEPRPPAGCTRSTASGRSGSGRATTATTTRTP